MRADFLILRADPLVDLKALEQVEWVAKDGVLRRPYDILPPPPAAGRAQGSLIGAELAGARSAAAGRTSLTASSWRRIRRTR